MKVTRISIVMIALSCGFLQARDIRTPLPFQVGPRPLEYFHYWRENYSEEYLFDFNIWGAGLSRSADQAFGPCGSTTKVPLSTLIFGKSAFTVSEAFANASVGALIPNNPFVSVSTISPRFDYSERAALFGASMSVQFGCDNQWQAGLRVRVPFRDISADLRCDNDLIGETIDDVFQVREETIDFDTTVNPPPAQENTVYAARLDFLSALKQIAVNVNGGSDDLVKYANNDPLQANPVGQITIAGLEVGQATPGQTDEPIIAVLRNNSGAIPSNQRWGNFNTAITGLVDGNGGGVAEGQRGRFVDTSNIYVPLSTNAAAQQQLFVVPTIDSANNLIVGGAKQILAAIRSSIGEIAPTVEDFLVENGIDFCDGRTKGVGDVDTEWYLGRLFCDKRAWVELELGIRFPTGKKITDCTKVLKQPTGNNGHFEVRIGGAFGYQICDWIRLNFDSSYSFVLRRMEAIAAPFKGATIKNLLPPCLCADISWGYYLGHLDVTLFASDCCGLSVGYSPYVKSEDKVWRSCDRLTAKLCEQLLANNVSSGVINNLVTKTTTDLVGRVEPLDPTVIEKDTKRVAHRIRLEFFSNYSACDIFGGWDHVVAGKNITQDTEWYLGFNVHF